MNSQLDFDDCEEPKEPCPLKYRWQRVLDIAEIAPASLCSWMLWQYACELDAPTGRDHAIEDQNIIEHVLTHIQHPAPKLILISALGFGCCVSSFLYRRQRDDPCQVLLIALVVGTVATVAYGVGASPDMMLLGLMPSATCAAMIVSRLAHDMFRTARVRDEASIEAQEKRQQP